MTAKQIPRAKNLLKRRLLPSRGRRRGRPSGEFSARGQILNGAVEVFGRKGYAATTVEDILQTAGVSRRTFYKFFGSKDEVFAEIFDRAVATLIAGVSSAVAQQNDPIEKVHAGIAANLRMMALAGPLARALVTEQFPSASPFAAKRAAALAEFRAILEREFEKARGQRVDPLLMGGLLAALDYVSVQIAQQAKQGEWDIERGRQVMLRLVAAALAGGVDELPPLPLAKDKAARDL